MAMIRATQSGSQPQETSLWSSSATTFAQSTITLSQAYTDFDYIKIKFLSHSTATNYYETIIPTSCTNGAIGGKYSTIYFTRPIEFTASTSLFIGGAYQYSSSNANNGRMIPREVIGIKTNVVL